MAVNSMTGANTSIVPGKYYPLSSKKKLPKSEEYLLAPFITIIIFSKYHCTVFINECSFSTKAVIRPKEACWQSHNF